MIVEEEPGIRQLFYEVLSGGRWKVKLTANTREALQEITRNPLLLVVIDLKVPYLNELELLTEMKKRNFRGETVILSPEREMELFFQVEELGVKYLIVKPFDLDEFQELVTVVMSKLEKRKLFL